MQKLLKFKLLIMIALLSYSTSWCQSNVSHSSTGEQYGKSDSVLISYDDIKVVNAKLIQLKYEKEINDSLRVIIKNDDKIIKEYNIEFLEIKCEDEKKPAFPNGDSSFLCKVIEDNSLCVVLSESATQLSNEKPSGYEDYIETANGSLMRSYRSKEKTTVKNKNYNLVYHELLNSMTDRGINFFVINMLFSCFVNFSMFFSFK